MKIKALYIFILMLFFSMAAHAQEDSIITTDYTNTDFLLEQDTIFVQKKKKKKRKKKTFNKLKTKRGFTTRGSGRSRTDELFFYLKKHQDPSKYITPVFVYDVRELKLIKLKSYNPTKYPPSQFKIPHGPYTKKKGDMILEEGYFWIGTFHDDWFKYRGEDMIVEERNAYDKGFPKNYQVTYYDPANQTIIKEINPIDQWKANTGTYKYYYETGRIKTVGRLEKGRKVGTWYEYYTNGKKKMEIEYSWNEKEGKEESKIINEWNNDGKLKEEYLRRKEEKEKEELEKKRKRMKY